MHFFLSKVPSDMNQVSLFFVTVLFPKPSQLKLGQLPFSHCFFSFSQSPTPVYFSRISNGPRIPQSENGQNLTISRRSIQTRSLFLAHWMHQIATTYRKIAFPSLWLMLYFSGKLPKTVGKKTSRKYVSEKFLKVRPKQNIDSGSECITCKMYG